MYRIGGLEPDDTNVKIMEIDGLKYVVSDKFKSMLRDSFINWGTFLEVYNNNLDYVTMFDQVVRLLNLKQNENLQDSMLPMLKNIYNLPANIHMLSMLKQFMIYEPVSLSIHALFIAIKNHYEEIFETFISSRNKYINVNNLPDRTNDLSKLAKIWSRLNDENNFDSSSIMLLFMNPPKGVKSYLNFNITGKEKVIIPLRKAVKKFHYPGFCPKMPYERLKSLLEFPINEFIIAIKEIDQNVLFPDYKNIEFMLEKKMEFMPELPEVIDDLKREDPPDNLVNKIDICKWYVNAILDLRKSLLKYGKEYEEYYIKQAEVIKEITILLNEELKHKH